MAGLLVPTRDGLYCPAGDFHIDPVRGVPRAVVTHAHADHARPGSGRYLAAEPGRGLLLARLGRGIDLRTLPYGAAIDVGGVRVSLHPAGHVLGSAQVRVERGGEVWAVSGDYKVAADPTCAAFEPVRCHTFVTESTFALPVYRWPPPEETLAEVNAWWAANAAAGTTSVLSAYSLGKAQRLLAGLDPGIGPILCHPAVEECNRAYREAGVPLPVTAVPGAEPPAPGGWERALVVAPPGTDGGGWLRRFGDAATAYASGWMRVRSMRRWRNVGRAFVLSDHADWPGLLATVRATGAARVLPTHGYAAALSRYLAEQGLEAAPLGGDPAPRTDD